MKSTISLPKVSVIIPVYNGSNFIREAIDSALAQSYLNFEVLVINDGSDDQEATESIAMSYDSKIRYFTKPNGGVSTALNLGIEQMTGDYFSWLSHDDVYKPDKLERQIEFLQNHHSYDTILYSGYELIDDKSKKINVIDYSKLYPDMKLSVSLFPVFRGLANGCTMLIHKSHFDRVGRFDEGLRTTQDYKLWFKMFRKANVKFFPGIHVKSRIHSKQTGRTANQHTEECDKLWIAMLNEVTDEEMCDMEGTPYHFYIRTADYLKKHSLYIKAEKHARELAEKEIEKNGGQVPIGEPKNTVPISMSRSGLIDLLRRLLLNIRYEGIWVTVRKVIRKL
jgi:glycosyltransferase involved in cell wall biosynthesis